MKIVGYRKSNFRTADNTEIKGYNIFAEESIVSNGTGIQTDKFYLSENKINRMGIELDALIGEDVELYYNRWGKVETIHVM